MKWKLGKVLFPRIFLKSKKSLQTKEAFMTYWIFDFGKIIYFHPGLQNQQ